MLSINCYEIHLAVMEDSREPNYFIDDGVDAQFSLYL
jgi:hypothetical protein